MTWYPKPLIEIFYDKYPTVGYQKKPVRFGAEYSAIRYPLCFAAPAATSMGLEFSSQEYVRVIINGRSHADYEDVQKIDGDYIRRWFPNDTEGYIHKIDDYFEYSANGTAHSNLDEGLKYDSRHPLLSETYRWGFEKRSHRENDYWDHLFDFAKAMNTSSTMG